MHIFFVVLCFFLAVSRLIKTLHGLFAIANEVKFCATNFPLSRLKFSSMTSDRRRYQQSLIKRYIFILFL